jgi:hypothetical protein
VAALFPVHERARRRHARGGDRIRPKERTSTLDVVNRATDEQLSTASYAMAWPGPADGPGHPAAPGELGWMLWGWRVMLVWLAGCWS